MTSNELVVIRQNILFLFCTMLIFFICEIIKYDHKCHCCTVKTQLIDQKCH